MKKTALRRICIFVCIYALLFVYPSSVFAQGEKNWYLQYRSHGEAPLLPEDAAFLSENDVIVLDGSGEKSVYLTFDAGYENGNIEKILDVLQEENVPGAFFLLPNVARSVPELVLRMHDEGHLLCNHTKSHRNMSEVTDKEVFRKELTDNEDILRETLGLEMAKYYRPPEGAYSRLNLETAKALGYKTVFWSLAYADWDNKKQPDPEKAKSLLLSRIHPGCVLLLHPTSATNAAIMSDLIKTLKADGYIFKRLDEFGKTENGSCADKAEAAGKISDYTYEDGNSHVIVANRGAPGKIALTFDDGPGKQYTEEILGILDEYDAKATFFLIGENAERYPEIVKEESARGHEIGNHTYSHPNMRKLSPEKYGEEIEKTQTVLAEITGKPPVLFRPPGGYLNNALVEKTAENGCTAVLWSWRQDTRDWANPSVEEVVGTVMEGLCDGDIILFHDFDAKESPTPAALRLLLPKLRDMGYEFVTVSELMNAA